MSIGVKVSGAWKDAVPSVNVGGAWKTVSQAYVRVAGAWKELLSNTLIVSHTGAANQGSGSSFSFTGCDIGPEGVDRWVAVFVGSNHGSTSAGRTIVSSSIGGVTGNVITQGASPQYVQNGLFWAHVPTGENVTIAGTLSGGANRTAIFWNVIRGSTVVSVVDSDSTGANSSGTRSLASLAVSKGGILLTNSVDNGATPVLTVTGLTPTTEYNSYANLAHLAGRVQTPDDATPAIQSTVTRILTAASFVAA